MSPGLPFRLVFPKGYDETYESWEAQEKGYLEVALEIGERAYQVIFYDPVRLAQDIKAQFDYGRPALPIGRLIVVPAVTRECMTLAIEELASREFGTFLDD